MNQTQIETAAGFLIERRHNESARDRLAQAMRPATNEDALAIQKAIMEQMGDTVGGWKCVLPAGETLNVAPIFANTIHRQSPCPILLDKGVCRIEPEIAFRFKQDLPPRDTEYGDDEIMAALAGAQLALELIQNRYAGTEEVSYLENLADCLFNQGMYLGPEIPLDKAINSPEIDFVLSQGEASTFKGKHPNNGPIRPVLWLANFLRQQGIGIKAGQLVITGSFDGVHEVEADREMSLAYGGLGSIAVKFRAA